MALNISTTTRIDKLIVVADFDILLVNIWQPISGNLEAQLWKWVCILLATTKHFCGFKKTYKLIPGDLWSSLVEHEPPGVSEDGGTSDVNADNHVPEEQPFSNKRSPTVPRRNSHDLVVWGIETQRRSGQAVGDQINPE